MGVAFEVEGACFGGGVGVMFGDGGSLVVSLREFVVNLVDEFGVVAVYDLLLAVDAEMGWVTEVVGSREEVERLLLDSYGCFDDDLWLKVRGSEAWARLERRLFDVSRRHLVLAVEEVVRAERLGGG